MQQESQAALSFLCADEKTEASPWDLAAVRASHAETVLELEKTRKLLLLEHRISGDLQVWKRTEHNKGDVKREKSENITFKVLHLHVGEPRQHMIWQ